MALLGIIIRRWRIRDQVPLREIARRPGISRNTVRRYLRTETIELAYAGRRATHAIDKFSFQLSTMLKAEAARSRKQRRTLKQIHEDLKELGIFSFHDVTILLRSTTSFSRMAAAPNGYRHSNVTLR